MCVAVGATHSSISCCPVAPTLQTDTVVPVAVGVSVGVAVNLGVFVGVRVRVGVAVARDTDVFVGVGVAVDVPVRVGVGVAVDDVPLSLNVSFTSTFVSSSSGLSETPVKWKYCFRVLSLSQ